MRERESGECGEKKRSKWWMNGLFIRPPHPSPSCLIHHHTGPSILSSLLLPNETKCNLFYSVDGRCAVGMERIRWNLLSFNHDEMMIFHFQLFFSAWKTRPCSTRRRQCSCCQIEKKFRWQCEIYDKFRVPFHNVIDVVVSHSFSFLIQCHERSYFFIKKHLS